MYELTLRTSCAGIDVQVDGKTQQKVNALLKQYEGEVGDISDKSVQLLFSTEFQRNAFEAQAGALGVIFD